MNRLRIRLLVALTGLFPLWWQRRYRLEFTEMLHDLVDNGRRDTLSLMVDIVVGALDAHVSPRPVGAGPRIAPRVRAVLTTAATGVAVSVAATLTVRSQAHTLQVLVAVVGALLSCYAVSLAAQPRGLRVGAAGVPVAAVLLAGVAGVVTTVIDAAVRFPAATSDSSHGFSILFGFVLAGYVVFAITPARWMAGDPLAVRCGTAAGLACGLAWAVIALTSHMTTEGLAGYMWPVGFLPVVAAFGVAAVRGGGRAGAQAGLWAGLVGATLFFVVDAVTLLTLPSFALTNTYDIAHFPRSGFPSAAAYVISDDLGGLIISLIWFPMIMTLFGFVGGVAGTHLRSVTRRQFLP